MYAINGGNSNASALAARSSSISAAFPVQLDSDGDRGTRLLAVAVDPMCVRNDELDRRIKSGGKLEGSLPLSELLEPTVGQREQVRARPCVCHVEQDAEHKGLDVRSFEVSVKLVEDRLMVGQPQVWDDETMPEHVRRNQRASPLDLRFACEEGLYSPQRGAHVDDSRLWRARGFREQLHDRAEQA